MPLDCDVTYNGFERDCEGSIGGVKAMWFINRNSITNVTLSDAPDSDCNNLVTAMTLATGTSFAKFGIQPLTSSFTTTVNNDIAAALNNYETAIVAGFVGMTAQKNCELQKFISGNAVAIVKDNNNRYWLIGVDGNNDDYALELGDGTTATTGTARGDANGYTLNLIHYTNHYPYEITQEVIDSLGLYPASPAGTAAKVSTQVETTSKKAAKETAA